MTKRIIQLGREPNRIDLLTRISGVEWKECRTSKVEGETDGIPVFFLSRESYIKNKLASSRPQDLADVSRLKEILNE